MAAEGEIEGAVVHVHVGSGSDRALPWLSRCKRLCVYVGVGGLLVCVLLIVMTNCPRL
jgi:hypothetical protein